ncbi:hypothetical protein PV327_006310 [Microctonus hyperodae]|uniref:Uncharacterized protein n=1 Tax=Microctonus hyperodae TaxID=165561 RepID=A0AA39F419_MICHY|nr:hypothetical protein PV327_006310 [Microctonus hyperodae]
MPPPENRPHEYPRPMLLSYTISQELFLPQDALDEIKKCIEYYRSEGGIDFKTNFNSTTTYMERLRNSLASKLPGRSRGNDTGYWEVIREMILPGSKDDKTSSDAFISVQFPPIGLAESLAQNPGGLSSNNIFLSPVNFKPDTNIVSNVTKSFGSQPSTSSRDCKKDNQDDMLKDGGLFGKIDRPDRLPTFRSGELTVSVKNVKMDFEPSPIDFAKLPNPLSIEAFTKMRSSLSSEFPLTDLSQHIPQLPDLSKLANFSPADLAKLSGFSLGDLTKGSPNAYANLFAPLNKNCGISMSTKDLLNDRNNDFTQCSSADSIQPPTSKHPSESHKISDLIDRKKMSTEIILNDISKLNRPTDFSTAEELSISSVRPDFGAMLDMKTLHGKNPQPLNINDHAESLNLSKDRQ